MACNHANQTIIEYLSGQAKHTFKDGIHDWSNEGIAVDRIVIKCRDCPYRETIEQGQTIPETVKEKIKEARKFVDQNSGGVL
jgi:hypothetical protein